MEVALKGRSHAGRITVGNSVQQTRPCSSAVSPDGISGAIRSFTLGYGTCEVPPGAETCAVPITIVFDPPDGKRPPLSDLVKTGQVVRVRGVDAVVFNGGDLQLETADFSVIVSVALPIARGSEQGEQQERLEQALRVVRALEGANGRANALGRNIDFRPKQPTPKAESATPTP